jgi:hypothetical protein
MESKMDVGEMTFLGMVIVALSAFAIALAYASWVASGNPRQKAGGSATNYTSRATKFRSADFQPTAR